MKLQVCYYMLYIFFSSMMDSLKNLLKNKFRNFILPKWHFKQYFDECKHLRKLVFVTPLCRTNKERTQGY